MSFQQLLRTPVIGLIVFAAACGGADQEAAVQETPAADAPAATAAPGAPAAAGTGQVHEVRMTTTDGGASGRFEPAEITVKQGDVIRWIQETSGAAHNVSFAPAINQGMANLPPQGPYLTTAGQTYEITVDMQPGAYNYQCDPHAMMGMVGKVNITQ